jgi:hypothetical protein
MSDAVAPRPLPFSRLFVRSVSASPRAALEHRVPALACAWSRAHPLVGPPAASAAAILQAAFAVLTSPPPLLLCPPAMQEVTFVPPVPPTLHGFLALVLLVAGFVAAAAYCTNPLGLGSAPTKSGKPRSIVWELASAGVASVLLGWGTLFLTLWAGIWV